MSILRASVAALVFTLLSGEATSALASGANAPLVTSGGLPSGGATYGVTDVTSRFNSVSGTGTGSVSLGGATASAGTAVPEASVQGAIGSLTPETQLEASSAVTVNFYINGPAGVRVPILFRGEATGSASGAGISSGGAFLETFGDDGRDALTLFSFRNCNSAGCGGSFDRTFSLPTGSIFSVVLEAGGAVISNPTATTSGPGAFSADVDPPDLIAIDPNFAALNPGFSLAINTGEAPAGVPEPASWALMIAGFGLAGAALRRRRTASA